MQNEFKTPQEAAKFLNRTVETLKVWRSKGKGPVYNKDRGGKIWYSEASLNDFIKKGTTGGGK